MAGIVHTEDPLQRPMECAILDVPVQRPCTKNFMHKNNQSRISKGVPEGGRFAPKAKPSDAPDTELSLASNASNISITQQQVLHSAERLRVNQALLADAWAEAETLSQSSDDSPGWHNRIPWLKARKAKMKLEAAWRNVGAVMGERRVLAAIYDSDWEAHAEALTAR